MLSLYSREVGFVISHAVVFMALGTVLLVELRTIFEVIPRTDAGPWSDGQGGKITGHVGKSLRAFKECSLGKWQHGRIVPIAIANIRDLLDDHAAMLAGNLRKLTIV